jgi:hypothetical protein
MVLDITWDVTKVALGSATYTVNSHKKLEHRDCQSLYTKAKRAKLSFPSSPVSPFMWNPPWLSTPAQSPLWSPAFPSLLGPPGPLSSPAKSSFTNSFSSAGSRTLHNFVNDHGEKVKITTSDEIAAIRWDIVEASDDVRKTRECVSLCFFLLCSYKCFFFVVFLALFVRVCLSLYLFFVLFLCAWTLIVENVPLIRHSDTKPHNRCATPLYSAFAVDGGESQQDCALVTRDPTRNDFQWREVGAENASEDETPKKKKPGGDEDPKLRPCE